MSTKSNKKANTADCEIVTTRVFDALRKRVLQAYTHPNAAA
jgi:hypothetical protein